VILLLACFGCPQVQAVEGPSAAGPIGGTDIRSALMPPPGLYGGTIQAVAVAFDFVDGHGKTIPALKEANLSKQIGGPFLYYIPDLKVLGGSVGVGGVIPMGNQCGHLFIGEASRCEVGFGDPYLEIDWGRFFGTLRPSRYAGAFPIPEGLSIMAGFGVVVPVGNFDHSDPLDQALSMGTNIWDFAPSFAVTYTTPPILAEGTEFSAKLYWNAYLENPATSYLTGDVVNVDFAVSEHIGPLQLGVAGNYAVQVDDDRQFGVPLPPDGRRGALLQLGGVAAYDLPEHGASLKLKATTTLLAENTVRSWAVVFGWLKKF
jgi:hypothetical protein